MEANMTREEIQQLLDREMMGWRLHPEDNLDGLGPMVVLVTSGDNSEHKAMVTIANGKIIAVQA